MMEDEFERSDFEHTLKEYADRFYMTPTEKVWKSLYNDLHPGSKWPSLAVALFMLLTLFWIGNSNRQHTSSQSESSDKQELSEITENKSFSQVDHQAKPKNQDNTNNSAAETGLSRGQNEAAEAPSSHRMSSAAENTPAQHQLTRSTPLNTIAGENKPSTSDGHTRSIGSVSIDSNAEETAENAIPELLTDQDKSTVNNDLINSKADDEDQDTDIQKSVEKIKAKHPKKLSWKYFASPMVSSVIFGGVNLNNSGSTVAYTPITGHSMNIADKLGIIVGANAYYPLTEKLSLASGVHVAVTGYNIYGQMKRPNTASVTFLDSKGQMFTKKYVSYYANSKSEGQKNADIKNYNWQIAVPVGFRYDVLTNKKFKVSTLSTVEPFIVMGSNAYLLSGDAGSYISDPSLVRRFNFNGNMGVLVSFSSEAANWEVGPNIRYQVLSTYSNIYPIKEHLISYGLHIAVSKKK